MPDMAGPAEASREFADAINRGDVSGAVACWTRDAALAAADGATARGPAELAARFEQLVQAGVRVEITVTELVVAGNVALGTTVMTMAALGTAAPMTLKGTVVYLHDAGRWRIAVDRVEPAG